jgi:hypothetical protein
MSDRRSSTNALCRVSPDACRRRTTLRRVVWIGAVAALGLAAGDARATFPDAGSDTMDSSMSVELTVLGSGVQTVELRGPVTVIRSDPRDDGGRRVIDTEIAAMDMVGQFFGQPIHVRQSPERTSLGEVRAQGAGADYPADSFFDVFVEVEITGLAPLVNVEPVRVQAQNLIKLPPLFDTYTHPPPQIGLVQKSNPQGPVLATIEGGSSHRPEQDPVLSLAPGSLDPATGYVLPKPLAPGLSRAGLGLQAGDDLDALSFGRDAFDEKGLTTLAFSVDPASVGVAGTGVNQEALAAKAEGGEFVSFVNGTNQIVATAESLVPVAGVDDLDALVDGPATLVDFDGDQVPDAPVFFTLAPGSPTLGAIGAGPGDVLVSAGGAVPSVFAEGSDYGLQATDVTDAICLMKTGLPTTTLRPGSGPPVPPAPGAQAFDAMLFSLAPGSPTLAAQGHDASDVFVTDFSNSRPGLVGQPLVPYAQAVELGLLAADDLDALKCLPGTVFVEIDGNGDLDGPGNGTGCGDVEVDAALAFDMGLENHDGDHLAAPSSTPGSFGFFDHWSIQNPHVGDYHGPYAYPGGPGAGFMPTGDPALDVAFVGGPNDNCGLPHVHGGFFGIDFWDRFGFHPDLDVAACGHGVFLPSAFPISVIPTRRDVPTTAQLIALTLAGYGVPVFWHLYDGPSTIADFSDCESPSLRRAVLVFSGLAVTQFNLALYGAYGGPNLGGGTLAALGGGPPPSAPLPIRIGPPLASLPPPLLTPEPSSTLGAAGALGVLAALARVRQRPRPA